MNEEKFITEKLPKLRRRCFNILEGYTPGEQPQNVEEWIKLNTNENPYPPPDQVKKDLQKAIEHRLRMYPDPTAKELRKAIVEKYVSQFDFDMYDNEENVLVANGSDETLDILFKTFI